MDPSYKNSFGGQAPIVSGPISSGSTGTISSGSTGGQAGAFGPAPLSSGTGDIILGSGKPAKSKKPIIIAITLLIVILFATTIVVFAIFFGHKSERSLSQNVELLAEELEKTYGGQCNDVVARLDDDNVPVDEYEENIKDCRDSARNIKTYMDNIDARGSDDFKNKYAAVKTYIDENIILGETIETELNICSAWHQWIMNRDKNKTIMTTDEINNAAAGLRATGNQILTAYADGWVERKIAATEAIVSAKNSLSTMEYLDVLNSATDDMSNFEYSNKPDIMSIISLDNLAKNMLVKSMLEDLKIYAKGTYE